MIKHIGTRVLIHFITLGIVAVLGSLVASLYYTDLVGVDDDHTVMNIRPNAPGTDHAIWDQYSDQCWRYEARAVATGALLRVNPNDPFIYTNDPDMVAAAIDQAVNDKGHRFDRVLAFCGN